MEPRHCVYAIRTAGAIIMACLAVLCLPAAVTAAEPASQTSDHLARGAGYGQPQIKEQVQTLQRRLRALGQQPGPVDGLFGPLTESAVYGLQRDTGLAADGIVGPQTRRVLNAETPPLVQGAGYGRIEGSPRVRAVQRTLRSAGLRPGPVDGLYGPRTRAAVARFQRRAGQPASGLISTTTARALAAGPSGNTSRADRPPSRIEAPEPAGRERPAERVERTPDAGPSSPVMLTALATLLAAIAALFAGWLRYRRRPPAVAKSMARTEPSSNGSAPRPLRPVPLNGGGAAVGYVSLSEGSGAEKDLREQTAAMLAACRERGLPLQRVVRDFGRGGTELQQRPGFRDALERLDGKQVSCLVVAGLERLDCSVPEVGALIERLRQSEVGLLAVDEGIDTGTPSGRAAADNLAALCAFGSPALEAEPTGAAETLAERATPTLREGAAQ